MPQTDLKCILCAEGYLTLRYSKRFDRHFYGCSQFPTCKGTLGAHQFEPYEPLGFQADPETKQARIEVHDILDPLWLHQPKGTRGRVYAALSEEFGRAFHVGECTKEDCVRAIDFLKGKVPSDFAALKEGNKDASSQS